MASQRTYRIAISGGPGGGKTTALDLFRREIGELVVVVPEAATLLFSGGFPRSSQPDALLAIQRAVYEVQHRLEETQAALFPGRIQLCDRGTLDGAAYWPGGPDAFCQSLNTTLERERNRYDAIIFFESAAVGYQSIEGGNPTRTESIEEAIRLDHKIRSLWSPHPHFVLVPHSVSFVDKIMAGLQSLKDVVEHVHNQNDSTDTDSP